MVSSRNTCIRGFASSRNQEGISEIAMENWNTNNMQKRRATLENWNTNNIQKRRATLENWNTNNIQKRRATFYIRINTKNSASI